MKALTLMATEQLEFGEAPEPLCARDELIVEVRACGICGTDLHGYQGHDPRRPPPLILGHEAAGVIHSGPRRGERVVINPIVTCMACEACRDGRPQHCPNLQSLSLPPRQGAFAERVNVPERNLLPMSDTMSFEDGALVEPTAVACHAVARAMAYLRAPNAEPEILVFGAGPIGLLCALVLKAKGKDRVTLVEANQARTDRARAAGVATVLAPQDLPGTASFDLIIDAVGVTATRQAACAAARRGGVLIQLGLMPGSDGLDVRLITSRELVVAGAYCYTIADFKEAIALLDAGRIATASWVAYRPLSEGGAAFAELVTGTGSGTKIILRTFA